MNKGKFKVLNVLIETHRLLKILAAIESTDSTTTYVYEVVDRLVKEEFKRSYPSLDV